MRGKLSTLGKGTDEDNPSPKQRSFLAKLKPKQPVLELLSPHSNPTIELLTKTQVVPPEKEEIVAPANEKVGTLLASISVTLGLWPSAQPMV